LFKTFNALDVAKPTEMPPALRSSSTITLCSIVTRLVAGHGDRMVPDR